MYPAILTATVKPVLSNHIKQNIFLAFQTVGMTVVQKSHA